MFTEHGYEVEIFNPNGGRCEADAMSRAAMPWRIEDELKRLGANFVQAGLWRGFAVQDGNLITGQQNFSRTETAELIVETLGR